MAVSYRYELLPRLGAKAEERMAVNGDRGECEAGELTWMPRSPSGAHNLPPSSSTFQSCHLVEFYPVSKPLHDLLSLQQLTEQGDGKKASLRVSRCFERW